LKSFGDALQQSILRNRYIPTYTNMASIIATELGVEIATVTNSPRKQPRFFLIDPTWQVGTTVAGQPYTQSTTGSVILPVNPRVLILSSIGRALPAGVVSGVPVAANFTNIWNAADGTVPAAPVFSGWSGTGDDVKIQRVNLSSRFVRLILNIYNSTPGPRYSIDSTNWATATVVSTNFIDAYFIQNSILALHTHLSALDSQQILIRDNSFVYNQNVWQGSIVGGFLIGGLDIATVVDKYLSSPGNPLARNGTNQQAVVVAKMQAFLDAYNAWADAGFPNGALKNAAQDAAGPPNKVNSMMWEVQGQYLGAFVPTNVPCPP